MKTESRPYPTKAAWTVRCRGPLKNLIFGNRIMETYLQKNKRQKAQYHAVFFASNRNFMRMRKTIFFLVFVCSLSGLSTAQPLSGVYPKETLFLSTDRNLYCSGERIWFSLFRTEGVSTIAYAELFDHQAEHCVKITLKIINQHYTGSLEIPDHFPTGHYTFRAYTYYQQNFSATEFINIPVTIIHAGAPEFSDTIQTNHPERKEPKKPPVAKIIMQKKHYSSRERVEVTLDPFPSTTDTLRFATLSVTMRGTRYNPINSTTPYSITDTSLKLPEIKGPVLHGYLSGTVTGEQTVLLAKPGNNPDLRIATTRNHRFCIPFLPFSEEKTLFMSLADKNTEDIQIKIEQNYCPHYPEIVAKSPPDDTLVLRLIRNKQIAQHFTPKSLSMRQRNEKIRGLLGVAPIKVALRDHIELASLQEVLFEIVPYVKIKQTKGRENISVLDDRSGIVNDHPIVFLDQIPVRDIQQLFSIHPGKIDSIFVINHPYALGAHSIDGFVFIQSNTENFCGYEFSEPDVFFSLSGFHPTTKPIDKYYFDAASRRSPHPDFRTTLYWNPEIRKPEDQQSFTFFTSDAKGDYEVVFQYITWGGNSGMLTEILTVD
ncbi:MAG: hypothetical protein M0O94_07990 [Bacteroidales bacterium]|nr:hypothetical protein [Bacteroidales bacterium]